jgi:hypothetical protein
VGSSLSRIARLHRRRSPVSAGSPRLGQQSEQPLGWDEQPAPTRHAAAGQVAFVRHASSPEHVTSHAQASSHRTPFLHDFLPLQTTVQGPSPQRTLPWQLSWPLHSTRHGVVSGQITSCAHDDGAWHAMTQTPPWHVPGQSAPHVGGASGGLASGGGIDASTGGSDASTGGIDASIGGFGPSRGGVRASTGIPASITGASSEVDWKQRPARPLVEAHQPSAPQT